MPNTQLQNKVVKTLATAQVLSGVGVAGTVAAGSLLVSSITDSETLAVKRASGKANAAAPSTALVCASPAKVSESVMDETKSDPAATVPATPTPLKTWAVANVLTTLF